MQVKDIAASVVLGLLFVSLLAIYIVTDQNPLVTGLSVIIIAICLLIVRVGDWREIGIVGGLAALVSVVAAYLLGVDRFGGIGAVLVPTLWAMAMLGVFVWFSANIQRVPGDRAILSVRTYTGEIVNLPAPLAAPRMPVLERTLAEIPLYPLSTDVVVSDINTKGKNVPEIHVHVEYKIADRDAAPRAMAGIPNRGLVQTKIAKDLGKTAEEARTDVLFWERLLDEQMKAEVDDVARSVIRSIESPYRVFTGAEQESLQPALLQQLNERVNRWGVITTLLAVDKVVIPGDAFPKGDVGDADAKRRENDYARIKRLHEAKVDAEADRVSKLIAAVRDAGIQNIPPSLLEDIIVSASEDPGDRVLDLELSRWFNENFRPNDKK